LDQRRHSIASKAKETGPRIGDRTKEVYLPWAVLFIGTIVLFAGCAVGVLRERSEERQQEFKNDNRDRIGALIAAYPGDNGGISLSLLLVDPSSLSSVEGFSGRTGKLVLTPMGMDSVILFFPDQATFDNAFSVQQFSSKDTVAVSVESGHVLPGTLEVVLVG